MRQNHFNFDSNNPHLFQMWNILGCIDDAVDADEIKSHLIQFAASHGFSSLFAGWTPSLDRAHSASDIAAHIFHDHEPEEWSKRYVERSYALRDPIVDRLQIERQPFSWDDAYRVSPRPEDAALIRSEASSFGLKEGLVVPIHLISGVSLAFSFGGGETDDDPDALQQLAFLTQFAAGRLLGLRQARSEPAGPDLTRREIECLAWAAEGKTDWEVGMISGISRSTVLKYIASARTKLQAVSRTHAVVKAIRLKLIS